MGSKQSLALPNTTVFGAKKVIKKMGGKFVSRTRTDAMSIKKSFSRLSRPKHEREELKEAQARPH